MRQHALFVRTGEVMGERKCAFEIGSVREVLFLQQSRRIFRSLAGTFWIGTVRAAKNETGYAQADHSPNSSRFS
jgi:hypothetical protein